jgi:uncharacterized protein with HEPN domain
MADKNIQNVEKIIGHAEKILLYCKDLSKERFLADEQLAEACVFNLIQIGELTTLLSDDFTATYGNIPWSQMRGLRNRIVHDYEGIDFLLIWDIISDDLADLVRQLCEIVGKRPICERNGMDDRRGSDC